MQGCSIRPLFGTLCTLLLFLVIQRSRVRADCSNNIFVFNNNQTCLTGTYPLSSYSIYNHNSSSYLSLHYQSIPLQHILIHQSPHSLIIQSLSTNYTIHSRILPGNGCSFNDPTIWQGGVTPGTHDQVWTEGRWKEWEGEGEGGRETELIVYKGVNDSSSKHSGGRVREWFLNDNGVSHHPGHPAHYPAGCIRC